MTLKDSEFAALRHAIAIRGTARIVVFPIVLTGWAVLAWALLQYSDYPIASIYSLAVLTGGYEAIHALHVGAERIGRYLQVYYEAGNDGPRWETTAMAVGPALPGGGIDPLFTVVFACAAIANLLPAFVPSPTPIEMIIVAGAHLAFLVRIIRARGAAARQRAVELESYRAIRDGQSGIGGTSGMSGTSSHVEK